MMIRHLAWKDAMTIKPLLIAILTGLVGIFASLAVGNSLSATSDLSDVFICFWVLMPNLVALGAPAMLVGTEEESGTLGWMRTLPVRWQDIADSKFMVAALSVAVAWVASSALMFVARLTIATQSNTWTNSMLSISGVSYLMFFSLLLLICGFMTAYLFRSPVGGLIAVVPLVAVLNNSVMAAGRWLLTGHTQYLRPIQWSGPMDYVTIGVSGTVFLVAAWSLQRILARRRLTSPETSVLGRGAVEETVSAYRPPVLAINTSRPKQTEALLWQQTRQVGALGFALAVIVAAFLVLHVVQYWSAEWAPHRNPWIPRNRVLRSLQDFAPAVIFIGACWLGSLAFYGDNVRRRSAFFADRGIAPTKIWWTRLLLPSALCLLLVAVSLLAESNVDRRRGNMDGFYIILAVNFAFGQLIGQWTKRPVLAFFAGPAFAGISMLALFWMLNYYPNHYWIALLVVPVLLVASWRLTPRWLSGRVDIGYHWRSVAYTALAISLPMLAIFGARVASTPEPMPQWRASVWSIPVPEANAYTDRQLIIHHPVSPDTFSYSGVTTSFQQASIAEQRGLLAQEIASNRIGEFVSMDDVNSILKHRPSTNIELNKQAIAVALKWAREIREHVVAGRCTFWDLDWGAETAEAAAVAALENMARSDFARPILAELVESIPDRGLRKESRRIGLINEWRAFQSEDWLQRSPGFAYYGKNFLHRPIATHVAVFPFERTRADRYVDKLTRLLLDQLEHGLPAVGNEPAFLERSRLWNEAVGPERSRSRQRLYAAQSWTEEYERRIDRLKTSYGVKSD